jgi:hypothetical protein
MQAVVPGISGGSRCQQPQASWPSRKLMAKRKGLPASLY